MNGLRALVRGLGLWSPGHANLAAWASGAGDPEAQRPAAELLSVKLRRRTSLMTRMIATAVDEAATQGRADRSRLRYVVASAWGELQTTVDLLESMSSGDGRVSPIAFTNSVHNTATGYLSIATENRQGSNAVAAGAEGLAMGLLDAILTLHDDGDDVMLAIADEAIPAPFGEPARTHELAAALHLSRRPADGAANLEIELRRGEGPGVAVADPGALDFTHDALAPLMRALHAGLPASVPLSPSGAWRLVLAPRD